MKVSLETPWLLWLFCLAASQNNDVSRIRGETMVEDQTVTVASSSGTSGSCFRPRDCTDVAWCGHVRSDVYRIWPDGWSPSGMRVYCDLENDGGGWTVIQRRGQFGNPQDYFYKRWRDYKFGFGNLSQEFWLGNERLYRLSNQDNYVLRVILTDHQNETRYAQYDEFYVEDETNKYKLLVNFFRGDAGDSLTEHSGLFFSTRDRDNDKHTNDHCANFLKGGWWYKWCHPSDLNGENLNGNHRSAWRGIIWHAWKGHSYSYFAVQMKIRPKFYL